jgi:hypothetical protein
MIMKKALWFSRHAPTAEQVEGASQLGYELVNPAQEDLGGKNITTQDDLGGVLAAMLAALREHRCAAVFGVFPTPIQGSIADVAEAAIRSGDWCIPGAVPCYAAWNVMRSVEGGKPTFHHKEWVYVGRLA